MQTGVFLPTGRGVMLGRKVTTQTGVFLPTGRGVTMQTGVFLPTGRGVILGRKSQCRPVYSYQQAGVSY